MNAPMTPPSNRMVRPGQRSRCASVAARSGIPTPANTTCPSLSWRALRMVNSSAAVWVAALGIVNARPCPCRFEQLFHTDQGEKLAPRFRAIHELLEVVLHAFDRLLVHEPDIIFQVADHRLVHAVAFVRSASERKLDDRINGKERDLSLIWSAPDLVVGDDALGG